MAKKSSQDKAAAQVRRDQRRARTERARAAAEERRRAQQRRQRLTVAAVVLAVVAVIVGGYLLVRSMDDTAETSAAPANLTPELGLRVGADDAPREAVIYEDFLCPACGALEGATVDGLNEGIEAGNIAVEYRVISILERISDYSVESANAFAVVLDAAGPEVAKEFHDLLYADQPSESGPFPDDDWFVEKAVEAGAEEDAVRPGIEDMAFEGWVKKATEESSKDGVNATPTVLLDGERLQGESLQEVAQTLLAAAEGG